MTHGLSFVAMRTIIAVSFTLFAGWAPQATADTTVFADSDFSVIDWSHSTLFNSGTGGPTGTFGQFAIAANNVLRQAIDIPAEVGSTGADLASFNNTGFTAPAGHQINSVTFSVDVMTSGAGGGVESLNGGPFWRVALEQDGVVYTESSLRNDNNINPFTNRTVIVTEGSLREYVGANGQLGGTGLDFSAGASPIRFGIVSQAYTNGSGAFQYGGYWDDLEVTFDHSIALPTATQDFWDSTFDDWTHLQLEVLNLDSPGDGVTQGSTVIAGPNDVLQHLITNEVNDEGRDGAEIASYMNNGFDPSATAPVVDVSFSVDVQTLPGGNGGPFWNFAVEQDGVVFIRPSVINSSGATDFTTVSATGLKSVDFTEIDTTNGGGGAGVIADSHPDFSATGATLHFGMYSEAYSAGGTFVPGFGGLFDEFRVSVRYLVPEPTTVGLLGIGFGFCLMSGRSLPKQGCGRRA